MTVGLRYEGLLGAVLAALGAVAATADDAPSLRVIPPIEVGMVSDDWGSSAVEPSTVQPAGHQTRHAKPSSLACLPSPPWAHRSGLQGELLVLRARDAEVAYALPVNGNVPEGSVGQLDPEFDLGFTLGLTKALDDCSSLSLDYTGFFSEQSDRATAAAPLSLTKLLVHPNEANAAANVPTASGVYEIDFQTIDFAYRFVALSNQCTAANLTIGGRWGRLDQELTSIYSDAGLTETVTSDIEFNGGGLRLGADIEHHGRRGIYCYGKTSASFLAGEFDAEYLHSSNVDPVRVASSWEAGRIVSIFDLEIGVGWQCSPCWNLSAGYTFSTWLDTVKTEDWIAGVQADRYRDFSDSMTFDGFVTRIEYRF